MLRKMLFNCNPNIKASNGISITWFYVDVEVKENKKENLGKEECDW